MSRIIKIDKGIYAVNNDAITYWLIKRNSDWKRLDENWKTKASVN